MAWPHKGQEMSVPSMLTNKYKSGWSRLHREDSWRRGQQGHQSWGGFTGCCEGWVWLRDHLYSFMWASLELPSSFKLNLWSLAPDFYIGAHSCRVKDEEAGDWIYPCRDPWESMGEASDLPCWPVPGGTLPLTPFPSKGRIEQWAESKIPGMLSGK